MSLYQEDSFSLATTNLLLRAPRLEDKEKLERFTKRNKEHLARWEPSSHDIVYEERFSEWTREKKEGKSVRLFFFLKESPEEIIGSCNFTQIFRCAFQACFLGYRIDAAFEGKGLMAEALTRAIQYMFETENLHRIMANYMPSNLKSERLLKKLGFEEEGFAKNYLLINGKWEDHILTALTNQQWKENR